MVFGCEGGLVGCWIGEDGGSGERGGRWKVLGWIIGLVNVSARVPAGLISVIYAILESCVADLFAMAMSRSWLLMWRGLRTVCSVVGRVRSGRRLDRTVGLVVRVHCCAVFLKHSSIPIKSVWLSVRSRKGSLGRWPESLHPRIHLY